MCMCSFRKKHKMSTHYLSYIEMTSPPQALCAPPRCIPVSLPPEVTTDLNLLGFIPLLFFLLLHIQNVAKVSSQSM